MYIPMPSYAASLMYMVMLSPEVLAETMGRAVNDRNEVGQV